MAANQFNLGNNNNGLLPPVGAQPVVPPLPLGNLAAAPPGGNNDDENHDAIIAAADAEIALGALQAAELLYPIAGVLTIDRVKEYLIAQMDLAEDAHLLDLSDAYGTLIELLNREPISEFQKQNLLANLDEIRRDLESEIKNIFYEVVVAETPQNAPYALLDILELYKALNKLDGRSKEHIGDGPPVDDEPRPSEEDIVKLQSVLNSLFDRIQRMLNIYGNVMAGREVETSRLIAGIAAEEKARVAAGWYPSNPGLTFLHMYLESCEEKIMEDTGYTREVLWDLTGKCDEVQIFRQAAAVRAAENINANNARFLQRIAINVPAKAAPRRPKLPLKTVEEAKAILEARGNGGNGGGPTDMGKEALGRIEKRLIDCFYETYKKIEKNPAASEKEFLDFIRKLLIDNDAVIAGGFILKTIAKTDAPGFYGYGNEEDMDIYVPCRNLKPFNMTWAKLIKANALNQFASSLYCVSFLRKNGIRSVQKLIGYEPGDDSKCTIKNVDIMAVRNKRRVLDVVQNFDLTFCQVWYDGRGVFATHPTHIQNRVGYLQKDYVPLFVMGNRFLRKRILKYTERGYKILLDPKSGGAFEDYVSKTDPIQAAHGQTQISNRPDPIPRDASFFKRWAAHCLLEFFLNGTANSDEFHSTSMKTKATNIQLVDEWTYGQTFNVETAIFLHPTDGYDSEDCDIDRKETFYPAIKDGLGRGAFDKFPGLKTLPEEDQWLHLVFRFLTKLYSPFNEENFYSLPYPTKDERYMRSLNGDGSDREDYRVSPAIQRFFDGPLKPFLEIIQPLTTTIQMDPISLDDMPVYHLHEHKAGDATSAESLKSYLNRPEILEMPKKTNIECYLAGCGHPLTMSEIHAIVPLDFYQELGKRQVPKPDHVPLENSIIQRVSENPNDPHVKAGITDIFQNVKTSTDGWGSLYHYAMCPFCLEYMKRDAGCLYVTHEDTGQRTITPYCNPKNIVDDLYQKYKTAAQRLRVQTDLLVCAECGRPCAGHEHFNTKDPIRTIRSPDYDQCTGGKRREMIARILAVRKVMRENPGLEPIELRRRAAFAADAAPNDADLLTKADSILALEARKRHKDQMNQVLNGAAPTPWAPPAPPGGVGADAIASNAENEAPLGAVGNVFNAENNPLAGLAANVFAGGRRRIGKPYTCSHGYTNSYKEKIPNTRKGRHGGSRMTRKKIE